MTYNTKLPLRETFGVVDGKTGKLYPDLLSYALEKGIVTDSILQPNSVMYRKGICYTTHIDSKLKRVLKEQGLASVIISFQKRTTGNIALARLYKENNE